jgi:sarcosine oxidase gamma subunit
VGDDPDEELLAGILGVVGMTEKPQGQAVHRMLELADQRREGLAVAPQVTFLVRTLAAVLLALSPGAWAARRDGTSAQRSVLIGLAGYMVASSLVDLYGFTNQVVGIASLPSIALRVILARCSSG